MFLSTNFLNSLDAWLGELACSLLKSLISLLLAGVDMVITFWQLLVSYNDISSRELTVLEWWKRHLNDNITRKFERLERKFSSLLQLLRRYSKFQSCLLAALSFREMKNSSRQCCQKVSRSLHQIFAKIHQIFHQIQKSLKSGVNGEMQTQFMP